MANIDLYGSIHVYPDITTILKGGTTIPPEALSFGVASTSMATGICSNMDSNLSESLGNLGKLKTLINSPSQLLRNELSSLIGIAGSSTNDLNNGLSTLGNSITNSIPEIPNTNDIDDLLISCGLLKNSLLSGIQSPASLLDSFLNQNNNILNQNINSALNSLIGLAEAPVIFLIKQINDLLKLFGLGDLLSGIDEMLNCFDSMCGSDVQPQLDYVNNMLNDMNIDDSGNYKISNATDEFNLDQDLLDNIDTMSKTIETNEKNAKESIEATGTELKNGIKKILTPPSLPSNNSFFS